ncbi:MAG TPA: trypsin-like peptidase domain-containing protein [Anaerolineae bacterium]|nr:trypsin-like peptidase domain-containing protein [Anaerolineae bacterium]
MDLQTPYQPYPSYPSQPPRRGLGFRGAVLILIAGMILGAIGGGVAGGLVAVNAIHQAAPASVAASSSASNSVPIVSAATNSLVTAGDELVAAVKKVSPAVVTVVNTMPNQQSYDFFGFSQTTPTATGSGVIISPDGYIVTNNHVIDGYQSLQVIYADGRTVDAKLIGTDQYADLAVIKVSGNVPAVAQLGDSDNLQIGESVIAIGSALGDFKNTVTSGVVSALNRSLDTGNGYSLESLIQTDAAINHGNSGGPLVNLAGQVIGINTAIVRSTGLSGDLAEGLGFTIPSRTVSDITSQLISQGYVDRPFLGIRWQMITPEIAKANSLPMAWGIYIQQVDANTSADQAGLKHGDILTAIGSDNIDGSSAFFNILNRHKVGEVVALTLWRNSSNLTLNVTLQSRPH